MSAMANLSTALEDLAVGGTLDSGQVDLLVRYHSSPTAHSCEYPPDCATCGSYVKLVRRIRG